MTHIKAVASITGISIVCVMVLYLFPQKLHSYYSGVVSAQVASFWVPDFQAPILDLILRQGTFETHSVHGAKPVLEPVTFAGSTTYSIPVNTQQTERQTLILTLQFNGPIGVYQSEPCLRVQTPTKELYRVLCQSVSDSQPHTLFLPMAGLGSSEEPLTVVTQLPEETTLTLSEVHTNIWLLTDQTEIFATVADLDAVTLDSNFGLFEWQNGEYVFKFSTLPSNQEIVVVIQATDSSGNSTEIFQSMFRVESEPVQAHVAYSPEPNGQYHAVITLESNTVWYRPLYLFSTPLSYITDTKGSYETWFAVDRYQEPISVLTQSKNLKLYDSFLQLHPLIETE